VRGSGKLINHAAGIGEDKICGRHCSAAIANVGDKHVREGLVGGLVSGDELCPILRVENFVSLTGTARDGDGSAVHVHLTVANVVEPSPADRSIASGQARGDCKAVGIRVGQICVVSR